MLTLLTDAEPTEEGFIPTLVVTDSGTVVFRWRGPFSFPTKDAALVYANDYGEVALSALRPL